jgi:hypothetical protein
MPGTARSLMGPCRTMGFVAMLGTVDVLAVDRVSAVLGDDGIREALRLVLDRREGSVPP